MNASGLPYPFNLAATAGDHKEGCPLSRPWMYHPDEFPLDCNCDEPEPWDDDDFSGDGVRA